MDAEVSFLYAYRIAMPILRFTKGDTSVVAWPSWRSMAIQSVLDGIDTLCRCLDGVCVVRAYTKIVSYKTTLPQQRCFIRIPDLDGNMVGVQEYKYGFVRR